MAMRVIRAKCKDPESVKFLEKVAEQYYPESGVYVTKFLITATNSFGGRVKGYGVASVHYSGNDPYKSENWQLNNASIEE